MLTSGGNLGGQFNSIGRGRFALGHFRWGDSKPVEARLAGDSDLTDAIVGKSGSH